MEEMSEEDKKELMQKVKDMSPEELAEFQKKQCIFCQIVAGHVPSKKVYEDDKLLAILDINPAEPGHVLIITKEHYSIMPQIPKSELLHIGKVSKKVSQMLLKGLKAQGTTTFIANGVAAGQKAQHFMVHVIPRMPDNDIGLELKQTQVQESELIKVREKVANKMNEVMGIKKEVVAPKQDSEQSAKEGLQGDAKGGKNEKEGDASLDDIAKLFK